MIVWILLVLTILFTHVVIGSLTTAKDKKKFLWIVGIVTFLVMGLRGGNYTNVYDLRVYGDFYDKMCRTPWSKIFDVSEFEVGYAVLNKALSIVFPFTQAIILFEAAFCVFCVCYFIYKNTDKVFWAFFFYVTLGSMGFMLTGFRQAIAMSICLLSVEFIKKKKLIWFIIFLALAITIHSSALVFLPLYFVVQSKFIQKKKERLLFVVILMMVYSPYILEFGKFLSQGELKASDTAVFSFNGIVPILLFSIGLLSQIVIDGDKKRESVSLISSPMMALGLGLYLMRFYNMALERLAWYYTQASYICLANSFMLIKITKNNKYVYIYKLLIIGLAFMLFYKRLQTADYAAYNFFWN